MILAREFLDTPPTENVIKLRMISVLLKMVIKYEACCARWPWNAAHPYLTLDTKFMPFTKLLYDKVWPIDNCTTAENTTKQFVVMPFLIIKSIMETEKLLPKPCQGLERFDVNVQWKYTYRVLRIKIISAAESAFLLNRPLSSRWIL